MSNIKWYAMYAPSKSGKKARVVSEPNKSTSDYGVDTYDEAVEEFKKGLTSHVDLIMKLTINLINNKELRKRLKKYKNIDDINKLIELEKVINHLNSI